MRKAVLTLDRKLIAVVDKKIKNITSSRLGSIMTKLKRNDTDTFPYFLVDKTKFR